MRRSDSDMSRFVTVHNGGLYQAYIAEIPGNEKPFQLTIYNVDGSGAKHSEYTGSYKTHAAAQARIKKYFKATLDNPVEWLQMT